MQDEQAPLILGRVNGVFGVKGWMKILSHTRPTENILNYDSLLIHVADGWQQVKVEAAEKRGRKLLLKLPGIDTPEEAHTYQGCELGIWPGQLPELPAGEFYWHQLIGLQVTNLQGQDLGKVVEVKETGANDVLVIQAAGDSRHKTLIPLVMDVFVTSVDLDAGCIQVDWEQDE